MFDNVGRRFDNVAVAVYLVLKDLAPLLAWTALTIAFGVYAMVIELHGGSVVSLRVNLIVLAMCLVVLVMGSGGYRMTKKG